MSLTQEQIDLLLQPLDGYRVRSLSGNSHLEAWDVRRWLLRVFGWGGWDFTVKSCDVVSERSAWDDNNPLKGRHTVVYRVVGVLTIKDADGTVLAVFEDGAMGDGINQPSLMAAHDFALKTAMSQALKRCAVNLGDAFGLSLYNKGGVKAVVGRSVAHPQSQTHEAQEDVMHGELDVPAPDLSETSTVGEVAAPRVESTPEPAPAAPVPLPEDAAQQEAHKAAQVAALRERVLATKDLDKTSAIIALGRVKIDAGKAKLMNAQTTKESGEPIAVGPFIDAYLNQASRVKA